VAMQHWLPLGENAVAGAPVSIRPVGIDVPCNRTAGRRWQYSELAAALSRQRGGQSRHASFRKSPAVVLLVHGAGTRRVLVIYA
jgi:hypothetical protein